jgi:hypothetical protein
MLPPFIIDQIRRREEEESRRDYDRPRLELPLDIYQPAPEPGSEHPEDERGVVILDLG